MPDKSCHLLIKGKVQGVYFRASAKEIADSLGLRGWVKNTPDGCVEVYAEGDDNAIGRFIAWCNNGPAGARVDSVNELPAKILEAESIFRLIR